MTDANNDGIDDGTVVIDGDTIAKDEAAAIAKAVDGAKDADVPAVDEDVPGASYIYYVGSDGAGHRILVSDYLRKERDGEL